MKDANLLRWVEASLNGETPIAVLFGEGVYSESWTGPQGEILSWEKAKPFLDHDFGDGYGSAGCPPVEVYTETRIFFIHEYDGSTALVFLYRNPTIAGSGPKYGGR